MLPTEFEHTGITPRIPLSVPPDQPVPVKPTSNHIHKPTIRRRARSRPPLYGTVIAKKPRRTRKTKGQPVTTHARVTETGMTSITLHLAPSPSGRTSERSDSMTSSSMSFMSSIYQLATSLSRATHEWNDYQAAHEPGANLGAIHQNTSAVPADTNKIAISRLPSLSPTSISISQQPESHHIDADVPLAHNYTLIKALSLTFSENVSKTIPRIDHLPRIQFPHTQPAYMETSPISPVSITTSSSHRQRPTHARRAEPLVWNGASNIKQSPPQDTIDEWMGVDCAEIRFEKGEPWEDEAILGRNLSATLDARRDSSLGEMIKGRPRGRALPVESRGSAYLEMIEQTFGLESL